MKITHEQFMEVAIAGFGKEEWKYDTRGLFESIKSIKGNLHKLYLNGNMILSIYSPNEMTVIFDACDAEFNHLAAIQKLVDLKLIVLNDKDWIR